MTDDARDPFLSPGGFMVPAEFARLYEGIFDRLPSAPLPPRRTRLVRRLREVLEEAEWRIGAALRVLRYGGGGEEMW